MLYHKFRVGETVIEFHNNWLGEETVIANGKIVSKDSSWSGMHHHFDVMENGHIARYVLTTRLSEFWQLRLDLRRNGDMIQENVAVSHGAMAKQPLNKFKKQGFSKLMDFDLAEATEDLNKALDIQPGDPEIYFHLACAYSLQEKIEEGFESLRKSVQFGLKDKESIFNHEMLAFLRIQEAFDAFVDSGFKEYIL